MATQILSLACAWLLSPLVLKAQTIPPLINVRAVALPAEVLLTWDAWPGAAGYGPYRANLDRRWAPIAKNVLAPRYRDADFQTLPCYYQVAAYNAAGDLLASQLVAADLWTNMRPPPYKEPEKYSREVIGGLCSGGAYAATHEVVISFGGTGAGGAKNSWTQASWNGRS